MDLHFSHQQGNRKRLYASQKELLLLVIIPTGIILNHCPISPEITIIPEEGPHTATPSQRQLCIALISA